jgi:PAS domain S-box-containing protein
MKQMSVETPAEKVAPADATASLIGSIFDLFGTLDPEGRVLRLQGRIFNKTNTNPSLLTGQRFCETVFWQSSENTAKLLEKSLDRAAGGKDVDVVLDFRISADEKVPMQLYLRRADPVARTVFCCAKQVSEKSQIDTYKQESEQLLSAAENADIGLWFWDFAEDKIYSTPQCNELLGMPTYEPVTYEAFLGVVHPEDREYVDKFLERSKSEGERYEGEFRVIYPDGSMDWICADGKSFLGSDGKPQRMMGVLRKITEQKLAAEELAKVYERERKARDEAEEANRAKDFFLAFVSHELRSPLNAILGWAKILLTKQVDEETRRSALETIERSAKFQTKLINDLVDSARVASGKLRLEYHPTNLSEIVRNSFEAQRPGAEAHKIDFRFSSDSPKVPIFGDAGRLQQVFTNLISNAIKFTPEGGIVSVSVETKADAAIVTVRDTGQGIALEALPYIFRQFSQGEMDRTKSNAGLGLGLSIVKILVTKHGGTVVANSEGPGQGSEFVVTIPLSEEGSHVEANGRRQEKKKDLPLGGIKVLIVEDEPDSREVLQLCLEQNGATVTAADSVPVAMRYIQGQKLRKLPSIIISDLAMPVEDGYTFMSRVRQMPKEEGGSIPSIALTAFATEESRKRAFEVGFHRYATKPFDPDSLIMEILDLLNPNPSENGQ